MPDELIVVLGLAAVVVLLVLLSKLIRIVPHQEAWVVERFGKFDRILGPGFHILVPIVQEVRYKHTIKEQVVDVAEQVCITKDNVQVKVDGILYLQVMDPEKASYGIDNYAYATAQLAQTTMRSEIGKIELDNTFSERDAINESIVRAVDEASDPWGIKVTRYEIRDISPTTAIVAAMEQQVKAEREKRAEILQSEGEKAARINTSKGDKEEAINLSKGEKQKRINEANGKAQAIEIIAAATAKGLEQVGQAVQTPRGKDAVNFKIIEQFITEVGDVLGASDTSVLPYDLANIKSVFQTVIGTDDKKKGGMLS